MTVEHIIVALIVLIVVFFTVRSLVRTWRGDSDGGCTGCPGCTNHLPDDETNKPNPQAGPSEGGTDR